jgi:hypothetical protein
LSNLRRPTEIALAEGRSRSRTSHHVARLPAARQAGPRAWSSHHPVPDRSVPCLGQVRATAKNARRQIRSRPNGRQRIPQILRRASRGRSAPESGAVASRPRLCRGRRAARSSPERTPAPGPAHLAIRSSAAPRKRPRACHSCPRTYRRLTSDRRVKNHLCLQNRPYRQSRLRRSRRAWRLAAATVGQAAEPEEADADKARTKTPERITLVTLRGRCGRCEAQPMRSASETMIPSGPRT